METEGVVRTDRGQSTERHVLGGCSRAELEGACFVCIFTTCKSVEYIDIRQRVVTRHYGATWRRKGRHKHIEKATAPQERRATRPPRPRRHALLTVLPSTKNAMHERRPSRFFRRHAPPRRRATKPAPHPRLLLQAKREKGSMRGRRARQQARAPRQASYAPLFELKPRSYAGREAEVIPPEEMFEVAAAQRSQVGLHRPFVLLFCYAHALSAAFCVFAMAGTRGNIEAPSQRTARSRCATQARAAHRRASATSTVQKEKMFIP